MDASERPHQKCGSPLSEAIYRSLHRRSERLQRRVRELEVLQRGAAAEAMAATTPSLDSDDIEDLAEAPDNEVQAAGEELLDQATAARTIDELKADRHDQSP